MPREKDKRKKKKEVLKCFMTNRRWSKQYKWSNY